MSLEDSAFIGTGRNPNPNVPDLPIGLGMMLAQNADAMTFFGQLSDTEKTRLISYVQSGHTGRDAENRIAEAVQRLGNGDNNFF